MKRHRIIEYEIPDDYTLGQQDWLERTLKLSIDGTYKLPNGCRITACEVDMDSGSLAVALGGELVDIVEAAREKPWWPPDAVQRMRSRGDI